MKWILLVYISYVLTRAAADCDACIEGHCYQSTHIGNTTKYYDFDVDRSTNTLYTFAMDNYAFHTYELDTGAEKFVITNKRMFSWATTDDETNKIYVTLSHEKGLFVFHQQTKEYEAQSLLEGNIGYIQYYGDSIYYQDMSSKYGLSIYNITNQTTQHIQPLSKHRILKYIADKRGDVYFKGTDSSNIYKMDKNAVRPAVSRTGFYTMTTNSDGSAIFIDQITRGVYKLNYETGDLDLIGVFGDYGLPLIVRFGRQNGNIIYCKLGVVKELYNFKRGTDRCEVIDSKKPVTPFVIVPTDRLVLKN